MNMKSDTAEFDTEIVGLNKRQLTARVLTMEQEQAKREQLLGDPARLAEYAVDKGLPVSEMRELLQANHRNNAPRLARYKEVLAIKPDARRVQFGWTELLEPSGKFTRKSQMIGNFGSYPKSCL